jgi:hypothetical protein
MIPLSFRQRVSGILAVTVDQAFTRALMRVFAMELHSACRVHPVPLEIKLRLEQLRLIELIRAQSVPPSPRVTGFEPLAAAG